MELDGARFQRGEPERPDGAPVSAPLPEQVFPPVWARPLALEAQAWLLVAALASPPVWVRLLAPVLKAWLLVAAQAFRPAWWLARLRVCRQPGLQVFLPVSVLLRRSAPRFWEQPPRGEPEQLAWLAQPAWAQEA